MQVDIDPVVFDTYDPEAEALAVRRLQIKILHQADNWAMVKSDAIENGVEDENGEMDTLRAGSDAEVEARARIAFTLRPIFVECGLPENQIDWRIQDIIDNLVRVCEIRRDRQEINFAAYNAREDSLKESEPVTDDNLITADKGMECLLN